MPFEPQRATSPKRDPNFSYNDWFDVREKGNQFNEIGIYQDESLHKRKENLL
jgi:hypothetical protein